MTGRSRDNQGSLNSGVKLPQKVTSQDNQGVRHGLNAPWQPGLVPVAAHVNAAEVSFRHHNEDQLQLKESLQCTGDQQDTPALGAHAVVQDQSGPSPCPSMYSQPPSVQSTTCSTMEEEEEGSTSRALQEQVLPNSEESRRAVELYRRLCTTMNNQDSGEFCFGHKLPIYGKQAAKRRAQFVQFVEVDTDRLKGGVIPGQVCVPLPVPLQCEFECCAVLPLWLVPHACMLECILFPIKVSPSQTFCMAKRLRVSLSLRPFSSAFVLLLIATVIRTSPGLCTEAFPVSIANCVGQLKCS